MESLPSTSVEKRETAPKPSFQEVKEGEADFGNAISIPSASGESKETVEARLLERLKESHWYLQEYWRGKTPQEQLTVSLGDTSVEIYNFGKYLEVEHIAQLEAVLRDYAKRQNTGVFGRVRHILFDDQGIVNPYTGEPANGWAGNRDGGVKIYPAALTGEHRVAGVTKLEGTVIHELSHSLPDDFISKWREALGWKPAPDDPPLKLPGGAIRLEINDEPWRCITDYARANASEDICESMVGALRNQAALDPERLKIINETFPVEENELVVNTIRKNEGIKLPELSQPIQYKRTPKRTFTFEKLDESE